MKRPMNYILDFQKNKEKSPKVILFELTKKCNLACRHCYNPVDKKPDLTTNEIISILKKVPNIRETTISFTGGEAMLRKDFFDIVNFANGLGFKSINIDTNGTLLNKENTEKLQKSGVKFVQVSIDGIEEMHDWVRGKGRFKELYENIGYTIKAGIDVMANMTVHKKNIDDSMKLWEFLNKLEVQNFKVEPLIGKGRGSKINDLMLDRNDVLHICNVLKELMERKQKPEIILDNLFKTYMYMEPKLGCPSARTFCVITKEGKMVHCPVFTDIAGDEDDVLNKDFVQVWENSKLLNNIRNTDLLDSECKECKHLEVCAGGCHARTFVKTGSFFGKDPMCPINSKAKK